MLSRLLLSDGRRRRRPPNLTHAADDVPPAGVTGLLAVQHATMAMTLVAYVVVAANLAGLTPHETRTLVTGSLLAMALGTILQAVGGRFGSGAFIVHITDPFMLSLSAFALKAMGPAGMVFLTMTDGLTQLAVSRVFPRLRTLLPPPVIGVVVCLGGLSLIEPAFRSFLGLGPGRVEADPLALTIAAASLGTIMAISIWGSPRARLQGLIAGVLVGLGLTHLLGWTSGQEMALARDWFALPDLTLPDRLPDLALLLPVVLISAMGSLDTMGVVVLMDKMNDRDWHRADLPMVARGLRAGGLANLICAPFGALPAAPSSANVGLCHVSRVGSRVVALATGLLIGVTAFMPVATSFLTALPEPVLGAIQVYAAAYLITCGMDIICDRALDGRSGIMVGTSLVVGMTVLLVPSVRTLLPDSLGLLAESAMASGGLVAVLLNLVFRLGSRSRFRQDLVTAPDTEGPRRVATLVETQCGHWGTRRDVARRASLSLQEAAEALTARGHAPLALEGAFDEYNLSLSLVHGGPPLAIGAPAHPDPEALLMGDDRALDAALAHLPNRLIRSLADRVTATAQGDGTSRLDFHFEH